MSAKKVLLTGGTGFVGANLLRTLLHRGDEAYLLVRPEHAKWRIADIEKDVQLHEIDLGSVDQLHKSLKTIRPDWIFHLSAFGAYSWQTDARQIHTTNCNYTINLVEAATRVGFEAFVNTGSSSEYGLMDHPPTEAELPEPNSHYAAAKLSATIYCRLVARERDFHIPTLRLYSVYGPYEDPNRLIPKIIVHGLQGRLPSLADPATARDFVYTDDVCDAYIQVASKPTKERGAIFNIGSQKQTCLDEVVEVSKEVLGIKAEPKWGSMEGRRWDTNTWVATTEKIRTQLGWQAKTNFRRGFIKTVDWYRSHPELARIYGQSEM